MKKEEQTNENRRKKKEKQNVVAVLVFMPFMIYHAVYTCMYIINDYNYMLNFYACVHALRNLSIA